MSDIRQPTGDCGCCSGITVLTPAAIRNRPGLSAINYRVGTHGSFKRSMLARLSSDDAPELAGLTTREDDDFSIALLDAAATLCDVVAFYQERIANESYLRTATERRSVLEVARSIGYELDPGVAASTYLAFVLEDAVGSPPAVDIPVGTRVQSVPGPNERPQTFETGSQLAAVPAWNSMIVRQGRTIIPAFGDRAIYLEGVATGLRPGDGVLLVGDERAADAMSERWDFRRVEDVSAETEAGRTLVTWRRGLGKTTRFGTKVRPTEVRPRAYALRLRAGLFGANAADWRTMPDVVRDRYLKAPGSPRSDKTSDTDTAPEWPGMTLEAIAGETKRIVLDTVQPTIATRTWIVASSSEYQELYQVDEIEEASRSMFGVTGKGTSLKVEGENLAAKFDNKVRETVVFAQSEELPIAREPIPDPVGGREVELEGLVPLFEPGHTIVVSGRRARLVSATAINLAPAIGTARTVPAGESLVVLGSPIEVSATTRRWRLRDDAGLEGSAQLANANVSFVVAEESDEVVSEAATVLKSVTIDAERVLITVTEALHHTYDRASARVLGNVVLATHGESTSEALGSGDATQAYQHFILKQQPVTYTFAAGEGGRASTLEVRVDDVLWDHVPTLFGRGRRDRVYVARTQDDGTTEVRFGDGLTGTRPSTGRENIRAAYRKGLGREGVLAAGQLSLLMTRPLGVRSVVNPVPATGGEDPEKIEDARANAPVSVLTLGRVVSLQDYADFARGFSGVAKAHAAWTWDGHGRSVLITVAGTDGDDVPEGGPVFTALLDALRVAADPHVAIRVAAYKRIAFHVAAKLIRDKRHEPAAIVERVRGVLAAAFSFTAGAFGRQVTESQVIALLQDVRGVVAVDLRELAAAGASGLHTTLRVHTPRPGDDHASTPAAELLVLEQRPTDFTVTP